MRTEVDFAGVFRAALPKVYISSIDLQPASILGSKNGSSHDYQADIQFKKNQYGKRKPTKTPARFDDTTGLPKGLKIKAELTIRDFERKSGKLSWLSNPDFQQHLKINVVLVRGREAIEKLEEGQFTPRFINRLKKRKRAIQKTLSASRDSLNMIEQKTEMIDGRPVYCVTYSVEFEIPVYNPRNLSLFASTFINLKEFKSIKLPQVNTGKRLLQGVVNSQTIINRGDVPTRSEIALLPDGKVWAGPVHQHPDKGLMTGAFHTPIAHSTLETKDVPNLVVNDYRVLDEIHNAKLLLRPYRKKRIKKLNKRKAFRKQAVEKNVYITQPEYAFNEINQLRFLFHVDYHKIIAEKTQFGSCFVHADKKARLKILNNSKIKKITVTRNRVKKGLSKNEVVLVDFPNRRETVAESGDGKRRRIRPRKITRSTNAANRKTDQITIGGIREIKLDVEGAQGLRTFTVSDFEMARKTDGKYSYSVSIEIEDGTILFVQEQQQKLMEAIKAFREYQSLAMRPNNTNYNTGKFSNNFIDLMSLQYPTPDFKTVQTSTKRARRKIIQSGIGSAPWLNSIAVYADVLSAVTDTKDEDIRRVSLLMEKLVSPISGSPSGLQTVLEMLTGLLNRVSRKVSGSAAGGKKAASISARPKQTNFAAVDYTSRTAAFKGKTPKVSFVMNKDFNQVHDSNMQNFVGYDFLNLRRRKNLGLRVVTTEQLANRLSLENQKFFNQDPFETEEPAVKNDNQSLEAKDFTSLIDLRDAYYSYLAPARVLFGDQKLKLVRRGRRLWRTKQYSVMASNLFATTKTKDVLSGPGLTVTPTPEQPEFVECQPPISFSANYTPATSRLDAESLSINVANSISLSRMGVSVTSPATQALFERQENQILAMAGSDDENLFGVDPKDVLGPNTRFATDRLEPLDLSVDDSLEPAEGKQADFSSVSNLFVGASIFSNEGNFSDSNLQGVRKYDPTNEDNFVDKRLDKFNKSKDAQVRKQKFMSMLPNHAKSIMLSADPRVNKNWFQILGQKGKDLIKSPSHMGLNYFNYCHINQIQVLVGFGEDRFGNPEISNPIYRRLTKEEFDRIEQSGRPFVCRMRPFRFAEFKKSKKFSLPEFNRHFLLVSSSARELLRQNPTEDKIRKDSQEEDTLEPELDEDNLFVSRLTEYSDLNTTGRKVLRFLIFRSTVLGDLKPEFTNTVFMQQPKSIARVGTTFASRSDRLSTESRSQASTLVARTSGQNQRRSRAMETTRTPMSTPRRSTTPATPVTTRMPSGGGSSGGSGGGY